jgi:hypothetical protein
MEDYGWIDFSLVEHQTFIMAELRDLRAVSKKYYELLSSYDKQKLYIQELEKNIDILQKTLNVINKNKRKRRVRCIWPNAECSRKR